MDIYSIRIKHLSDHLDLTSYLPYPDRMGKEATPYA